MNNLSVKLKNCYGINSLEHDFNLSRKTSTIYAPNGAMKTSFSKTFKDISEQNSPVDMFFPDRDTQCEISVDDEDLNYLNVFVIDPYNEEFKSEKMSTLLVNKDLRKKYDDIHKGINDKKDSLITALKKISGMRSDVEERLSSCFTFEDNKLFIALERIEKEVLDGSEPEFSDIKYKNIFNDRVLKFLETKDFKSKINDYIQKYDELVDSSVFFKRGVFNHNNASVIAKSLADNGFFDADHSVSLNSSDDERKEVKTVGELTEVIEHELHTILTNPELEAAFKEIDDKLKAHADLRAFRDYLLENMKLLPELNNPQLLNSKIWISYLKTEIDNYKELLSSYQSGKEEIEKIVEQAKNEKTSWLKVISIFNKRFTVPFRLEVQNIDDVILKNEIPIIKFTFKDSGGEAEVDRDNLLKGLSNGEKRALYILNIIFEVEARKESDIETIFIIDDIADSFDYKNKYAIVEYLKEISENDLFYQIILTHNFDFFRTIVSRFNNRDCSYMIVKNENEIKLIGAEYLRPFNYFKNNLHNDDVILIATIPFVRNLIEYSKGIDDENYIKLTSLLHIKETTNSLKKEDLENIFNSVFGNEITLENKDKNIYELIHELADAKCKEDDANSTLEGKILLSIAIRLKAESSMIDAISNPEKTSNISSNQTFELFNMYRELFPNETSKLETLSQVNLMTPENIHFNSFMYEPILDMSDDHLKTLYTDLLKL